MRVYENAAIARWGYQQIHKAIEKRGGDRTGLLHASEVLGCGRKTVLNRTSPPPAPSADKELQWAIGYALQEFVLGPEADGKVALGIILSADRFVKSQVLEFKTTRMSYEGLPKGPDGKGIRGADKVRFDPATNQYSSEWLVRCAAYCAVHNVKKAHIFVVFIYQNILSAWTVEFNDADLAEAKRNLLERRDEIQAHLDAGTLPPVTMRRGAWECKTCPHLLTHCLGELTKLGLAEGVNDDSES